MKYFVCSIVLSGVLLLSRTVAWCDQLDLTAAKTAPLIDGDTESEAAVALYFDLSSIPAGAEIDHAELILVAATDTASEEAVEVKLYAWAEDWNPASVPHTEDAPTVDSLVYSGRVEKVRADSLRISVTSLVSEMYAAVGPNYGFLVRLPRGSTGSFGIAGGTTPVLRVYYAK